MLVKNSATSVYHSKSVVRELECVAKAERYSGNMKQDAIVILNRYKQI